jgi:hypothetical protein
VNTIAVKKPKLVAVNTVSLFLSYNRKKIWSIQMINERTNEELLGVMEIEELEEVIAPGVIEAN